LAETRPPAEGSSHEKIAERLGISSHTVTEHGRWIYNRLDIGLN
jgi:DNA-binding CsgD family transcriptional regulator